MPSTPPRPIKSIGDLTFDPKNARRHSPRNIGAITSSLQKVGAARSIVVDEDGVILAGNGTVEAAAVAGIEKVIVVPADGNTIVAVQRTGLTPRQKAELAIADNRTSDLSEFDAGVLEELAVEHDLNLSDLDISEGELESWRGPAEQNAKGVNRDNTLTTRQGASVKAVIAAHDLKLFEQAIQLTGKMNRGEALLVICKHYVDSAGQRFGAGEGGAPVAGAQRVREGEPGPAGPGGV